MKIAARSQTEDPFLSTHADVGKAEDLGPRTLVISWTFWSLATVFIGLRVFYKISKCHRLWWDDYFLIASWVTFLVDASLTTRMVHLGYGSHFPVNNLGNLTQMALIGPVTGVFAITSIAWSKTSFAITVLRLSRGWMKRLLWFIIVSMNLALGITALAHFIKCNPLRKAWKPMTEGTCWPSKVTSGIEITGNAYSAVLDMALAFLPIVILKDLQLKRREKIGIMVAMSMGVFAAATAIVKCTYLRVLDSSDYFHIGPYLSIWGAAEIGTTIVAACIPVLQVLVRDIGQNLGRRNYYFSRNTRTEKGLDRPVNTGTARAIGKEEDPGASASTWGTCYDERSGNDHGIVPWDLSKKEIDVQ